MPTYKHCFSSSNIWRTSPINAAVRYLILLALAAALWTGDAAAAAKVWINQGPEGGIINMLAIDPQSQSTVYAGCRFGGVFKSTDGGIYWNAFNADLSNLNVYALAINPQSPQAVYAGTKGGGVFKSTNGGANWTPVNTSLTNSNVYALAIDPQSPAIVYAGTNGGGIFKSTDGGANWSSVNTGLSNYSVYTLAIDPQIPAIVYAGTDGGGIFKSINGGTNWSSVNTGLSDLNIHIFAIDPQSSATVYAGTDGGVFKSTDGGANWTSVNTGLANLTVYALAIDPQSSAILYAGSDGGGIFKSTNGGANWSTFNTGLTNLDVESLAIDSQNPATIYAGTNPGGVFKNTNGSMTWSTVNTGLTSMDVQSLAIDPQSSTTVYASVSGQETFKSYDGGIYWRAVYSGLDLHSLRVDPQNPGTLYAGTWGNGVVKSINGGTDWVAVDTGLTNLSVHQVAIDPQNPANIYAGTDGGVFKSTNSGASWNAFNDGLTHLVIHSLAIDPLSSATVYAGTGDGAFKSIDGGIHWSPVNADLRNQGVFALAVDPQNMGTLYAGTWGGGIFKSINGGANWNAINTGLTDLNLHSVAIDPQIPEIVYAGTQRDGVFQSTDGGANWSTINTGLTIFNILSLEIDSQNPATVYAATRAGGVFKLMSPPGCSSVNLALNSGGAATCTTMGLDQVTQAGYGALTVNSGDVPYGTAVFSFRQNGVTVTEAGVPASPPTTAARIFIDIRSGVDAVPGRSGAGIIDINTGIAIVNFGSATANVAYTLRDVNANLLSIGHGTIPAGTHFAKFIDQLSDVAPDFNLPPDFQNTTQFGSLEISSDQPISIVALRGTNNQRNDFLITTTPTADLTQSLSYDPIYFPQFADGGGYTTSLVLLNTSDSTESGTLQILDNNGAPLIVNQVGGTTDSSFRYSIPSGGAFHFQTDGFPAGVNVGWVRLTPDAYSPTPIGSGVFSYNPGSIMLSESGIPATVSTTHARVYVDLSGNHNTGLAIANVTNTAAHITINAFQKDGFTAAGTSQGSLPLAANGQDAQFADQFIAGLPSGFKGVLDISSATPFAALTIRSLLNERHDFLMTTFPIADANRAAPLPIAFPQIADGGGYVTQFILLSSAGGSSTILGLYDETGDPLDSGN